MKTENIETEFVKPGPTGNVNDLSLAQLGCAIYQASLEWQETTSRNRAWQLVQELKRLNADLQARLSILGEW